MTRRVWKVFMRRWRNRERGVAIGAVIEAAIGAVTVAVTVLATDLAAPSGMEEAAVDVLVPSPSLHLARLGGTMRAGAAAVVAAAAAVVAGGTEVAAVVGTVNSEAMEVEGAEGAATVRFVDAIKICLHLPKRPLICYRVVEEVLIFTYRVV